MLPYLLLLVLIPAGGFCLERYKVPKWNRIFLLSTGVLFWIFASLRFQMGFDYQFYNSVFEQVSESGWGSFWKIMGMEPLYLLLNKLVAVCGGDYRVFLFLFHGIFLLLLFSFIYRRSDVPWLSVYLFLTLQYFALSMNLLRQSMAAMIFLVSYRFIREKKLLPYLLAALLAIGFHRSALLMLPLYFLLRIRPSFISYGILGGLTLLAYFLIDPILNLILPYFPHYQEYTSSIYWQANSFVYLILPVLQFLAALYFYRSANQEENRILINAAFFTLLISLFITKHFVLERFSMYPSFLMLIALPNLISASGSSRKSPLENRAPNSAQGSALYPWSNLSRKQKIGVGVCLTGGLAYFLFAVVQGFHDVYPYYGIWDRAGG